MLQRGLRASPKNTWVLQALALIEWERGRVEEADGLFMRAIKHKPWDGGLYQTYGVLLHKKGNVQGARALFKEGSLAAKGHPALWQAWALMEAEAGKVCKLCDLCMCVCLMQQRAPRTCLQMSNPCVGISGWVVGWFILGCAQREMEREIHESVSGAQLLDQPFTALFAATELLEHA